MGTSHPPEGCPDGGEWGMIPQGLGTPNWTKHAYKAPDGIVYNMKGQRITTADKLVASGGWHTIGDGTKPPSQATLLDDNDERATIGESVVKSVENAVDFVVKGGKRVVEDVTDGIKHPMSMEKTNGGQ